MTEERRWATVTGGPLSDPHLRDADLIEKTEVLSLPGGSLYRTMVCKRNGTVVSIALTWAATPKA